MATKTHVFEVPGQHPVTLLVKPASFQVVYGASSKDSLDYDGAALELGHCLMHALACNGLMNENELFADPTQDTLPPAVVPGSPDGVKLEYPGKVPTQAEMVHLETLIDRCGLCEVLVALDVICGDKAAHIRANGTRSDNYLARRWEGAAKACRRAAGSKAVEYVDPSYPT